MYKSLKEIYIYKVVCESFGKYNKYDWIAIYREVMVIIEALSKLMSISSS
ncbi:hypothetical protein ERS140248_00792 [Staphylococcus argenteus]|nr:hypothetical protein ERS140248_00792 [Staphylococcus argenteus]